MQIVAFLLYSYYLSKWMEGTGALIWEGRLLHDLGGEHLFKGHGARTKEWVLIRGNTVYRWKKCQEIADLLDGYVEANG